MSGPPGAAILASTVPVDLDLFVLLGALRAARSGDLRASLPLTWTGTSGEIATAFNDMMASNLRWVADIRSVSTRVGQEGRLGTRMRTDGLGEWGEASEAVNTLIDDLAQPTRDVTRVIGAVARGDFEQRMALEVSGDVLLGELGACARTVNAMVDGLTMFSAEVTRVTHQVGAEGELGRQADLPGLTGTWKVLTDRMNWRASHLAAQVRDVARVITAVAAGDLSRRHSVKARGEMLQLMNTIDGMVDQLESFTIEVKRVAREVGTEGRLGGKARVQGVSGTWRELIDDVNFMADNLTGQLRNIAYVTTAVARGDLTQKVSVDVRGEMLELKDTVNTMVEQLSSFASEVTRVAREVGTEGKLGGQAHVRGVAGTWKDLTDNVNFMAANLTGQMRNIAEVTTAVAHGDLSHKITVDVQGEFLELKNTVNTMVDHLEAFGSEVSRVAREVGVDGRLGGRADVPAAAGLWGDLKDNVNELAANLSTQVRTIAEVVKAVSKGDLTRMITVEFKGEVESLKLNINEMIVNLKDTTQQNTEQDWLKTNLAKFSQLVQGERDLGTVASLLLSELATVVSAHHAVFYIADDAGQSFELLATYACTREEARVGRFALGEGLVGQCARERSRILIDAIPANYVLVSSGLGAAAPTSLLILPVLFEGRVMAVLELARFGQFSSMQQVFLDQLTPNLGVVLNTLAANMRTVELLNQSRTLTQELLHTNDQLEEKAQMLSVQKMEVEVARRGFEEKAELLSVTSRYKSEFLANMSHELRTPLNSLLILARLLADNTEATLTSRQIEFARSIHSAGSDLLLLINDILDLSKIESGMIVLESGELLFADLEEYVLRTFRPVAVQNKVAFEVEFDPNLRPGFQTDASRLLQILKNLLSNAFKFTEFGKVTLSVRMVASGWTPDNQALNGAQRVLALSVTDTGIGIREDKLQVIFEAFQQADMTTSRRFGGTGLGLSISRELARMLGGEVIVESVFGVGSVFTLFVAEDGPPAVASLPPSDAAIVPTVVPEALDRRPESEAGPILLVIERSDTRAEALLELGRINGFRGVRAASGGAAIGVARRNAPSAIVFDMEDDDAEGWYILDRLRHDRSTYTAPTIVIGTAAVERRALQGGATSFVGLPAEAPVIDGAVGAFLEGLVLGLTPEPTSDWIDPIVAGRTVLVADDDPRNLYAITSLLEQHEMRVLHASNGREAVDLLKRNQSVEVVLMDIMMPEMDGYEAMRVIRADPALARVSILALTAKAMKGDRERCIESGASDYVPKPVDTRELMSTLRVRLHAGPR